MKNGCLCLKGRLCRQTLFFDEPKGKSETHKRQQYSFCKTLLCLEAIKTEKRSNEKESHWHLSNISRINLHLVFLLAELLELCRSVTIYSAVCLVTDTFFLFPLIKMDFDRARIQKKRIVLLTILYIYKAYPFRWWAILCLHSFLSFQAFSKFYIFSMSPIPYSASYLDKHYM